MFVKIYKSFPKVSSGFYAKENKVKDFLRILGVQRDPTKVYYAQNGNIIIFFLTVNQKLKILFTNMIKRIYFKFIEPYIY